MKVKLNCVTQPESMDGGKIFDAPLLIEEYMIYAARVSSPDNRLNHETAPKLLEYLIDSKHWSPFEMVSMAFEIETSRAIAQQLLRHRSFSFQEFSQRYAEVTELEPVELRYQAKKNRQSSTDVCDCPELVKEVNNHLHASAELYRRLLRYGIAKESARFVLPLTAQTTLIMHGTLRSWIHFLDQRCDEHAQKEVQLIALEIRKQLTTVCPWTASALGWNNTHQQ